MITYLAIFALLFVLELIYMRLALRLHIVDRPNERSSHSHIVLRGGGIVFLLGVWLWAAFFGFHYPWFLAGMALIAVVSFVDDVHSLPDSWRLVVQFASMILAFVDLAPMGLDWWWEVAALIVCVGILNAYNFMDGINGITGGYSLAVLLPLLYLDTCGLERLGLSAPFIEPSFLLVATLSALVLCFFNFRTKAKCFAGDVGSIGVAFIIVFALARLMVATQDVSYIAFLLLYGVDSVLTICHRILLHENLGVAHRKHAFQLMTNELKMPHLVVSSIYMSLQLVVSFGMIFLSVNNYVYCLIVGLIVAAAYLLFMKKYYHLHEEYLASLPGNEK